MEPLPAWLAPSAITDIVQLLACTKPVVRIRVDRRASELRRWARRLGLFTSSDLDGYAALSRDPTLARRVLDLDRRPGRHTFALGMLLGYPACCSRTAARVGDEGIDGRHAVLATRRFHGRFRAIDPEGYASGSSKVSHVPCSHRCIASLSLATRAPRC
ncbi:hypothetical protein GCM10009095_29940 [Sphingomonas molluscorum]